MVVSLIQGINPNNNEKNLCFKANLVPRVLSYLAGAWPPCAYATYIMYTTAGEGRGGGGGGRGQLRRDC